MQSADPLLRFPGAKPHPFSSLSGERIRPAFPQASRIGTRKSAALRRRQRPAPSLDPVMRARVGAATKWMLVLAVLSFIAWAPAYLYSASQVDVGTRYVGLDLTGYYLSAVLSSAVFATVVATGIPRAILPSAFGKWNCAVDAARDWLAVGLVTGLLYWGAIFGARAVGFGPADGVRTPQEWISYRLPLMLVAGIVGVLAARRISLRRQSLLSDRPLHALWQLLLQVGLLVLLERPLELMYPQIASVPGVANGLGVLALFFGAGTVGIIGWAIGADSSLSNLRRRRGGSGLVDGSGPVNMTLTVIGGRESGKTVLLAGGFYEWSTQRIGDLRITPSVYGPGSEGDDEAATRGIDNLEEVARELYINHQFPVGTISTHNLPFDLSLGQDPIARFSFLDYPGGAIASRAADDRIVQEFWDRVEDTDGILLIADMSYVRRGKRDADFLEVRNAYLKVMQRLVDRNGKRRVVPVALVLTKCDEFIDPDTGIIDTEAIAAGLREFQYDELEEEWLRLNEQSGPGFAEFTTWVTSAITYSQPQSGPDGLPDYSKPFEIVPGPPAITPSGCASPLLWMTSKVMRWNATLFFDIRSFLLGSTPQMQNHLDAILELESIAEERASAA